MSSSEQFPDVEGQQRCQTGDSIADVDGSLTPSTSLPLKQILAGKTAVPLSARSGQCCFLCLKRRKSGHFAVQIPCLRPSEPRKIKNRRFQRKMNANATFSFENVVKDVTYEALDPLQSACESDHDIYKRLREAAFQHHGKWKQWIPFYGINDVQEVTVRRFELHVNEPIELRPVVLFRRHR